MSLSASVNTNAQAQSREKCEWEMRMSLSASVNNQPFLIEIMSRRKAKARDPKVQRFILHCPVATYKTHNTEEKHKH